MKLSSKFYLVKNLREIREMKYKSRKAIAKEAKISEKTIERAESGKDRLEFESIKMIAKALGVSPQDLIDEKRSNEENEMDKLNVSKNEKTTPYSKLAMKNYRDTNQVEKKIKVNISMDMKESDFLKVVDKIYEQYKDKFQDLQGMDECNFNKKEIKMLKEKIISLRLEEEVTLRIIEAKYLKINKKEMEM